MNAKLDDVSIRLLAAKSGFAEQWMPQALMRRVEHPKGGERLQQIWISVTSGRFQWRDVPLFTTTGEEINEGDAKSAEPIYNPDGSVYEAPAK